MAGRGRPPGIPKTGGRKKGVPNKITSAKREAFMAVFGKLEGDIENWIREGAKTEPLRAAEVTLKMADFHFPKKRAVEVAGPDGGALTINVVSLADNPSK